MGKLFLILAFFCHAVSMAQYQRVTVDDLLHLSALPSKSFESYIEKKGFTVKRRSIIDNQMGFSFFENKKLRANDSLPVVTRSIDLYKKNDTWCIAFHTSSEEEYIENRSRLKKMQFFCGSRDTGLTAPMLYQNNSVTLEAGIETRNDTKRYTILLTKKKMPAPSDVQYAEDLLGFESHEYLVSFFGANNVKKDVYVFSENESKICSVLFPNTSDQAVFIWDDENNLRKLSYILISGLLSTPAAAQHTGSFGQNRWMLKNGIYPGMRIGDLLKLNANDFKFYGKNSEFSFMVEPKVTGNINFKWIGVMLNCFECDRSAIMNRPQVSATEAVDNNLALHVSYIMIRP